MAKVSSVIKKDVKVIKKEYKNILVNVVFATLTLAFAVIFFKSVLLATILLASLTVLYISYYRSSILIPVFIFCMIGAVAESIAITEGGVWSYAVVDFFNIPLWLFIVWGNAGMFIYRSAVEFERLGFHD